MRSLPYVLSFEPFVMLTPFLMARELMDMVLGKNG